MATSNRQNRKRRPKRTLSIERTVRKYADALGLRDYEIIFKPFEDPLKDSMADISVGHGRTAYLRLHKDFFTRPKPEQMGILAHELAHVIVEPMATATEGLEGPLGELAYSVFSKGMLEAEENVVENLAKLLVKLL
jgi:hypothetical protein